MAGSKKVFTTLGSSNHVSEEREQHDYYATDPRAVEMLLELETFAPLLATGTVLGLGHLILRPLLRLISAPLGCLTLGLFGMVIDVGLLYGCASLVEGYAVPDLLCALLTAVTINAICAVAAGRR